MVRCRRISSNLHEIIQCSFAQAFQRAFPDNLESLPVGLCDFVIHVTTKIRDDRKPHKPLLEELGDDYWQKHCGTTRPEPKQVLDILTLRSHWGDDDDDGIDTFDFSLPGGVTDYVISVSFDDNGDVTEITMES